LRRQLHQPTPQLDSKSCELHRALSGKKDGIIVLATHYETNYPLRDINSSERTTERPQRLLIEIGTTCRPIPPRLLCCGWSFDDGEEAVESWSN